MESPRIVDDEEVIADSEEEMDQGDCYPDMDNGGLGGAALDRTSSVSTFSMIGHQPQATGNISSFTTEPSGDSSRPGLTKEKYKEADTSIASAFGAFTDLESISSTISIADRAKMRQRTQKPVAFSDIIEITSEEDDYDGLTMKPSTSKAKTKAKRKLKPKSKEKETEKTQTSVNNITEPPTESTSIPKPRPRPRPKYLQPAQEANLISSLNTARAPDPPTSTPPPPEIPIATFPPSTSMAQQWQITNTPPSQLPPSDPPAPSMTTAYQEDNYFYGLPRIETLPGVDGPPSSPSSLFSEYPDATKKRKRAPFDMEPEFDELASSQGAPHPHAPGYISPRKMPPPPTFFAGSSSSSMGGRVRITPEPEPEPDIVDLTILPPTIVPLVTKKPAAKRAKVAEYYDDDIIPPPMIIFDEDDQDEDFDPSGDGEVKKKKIKGKAKEKAPPRTGESKSKKSKNALNAVPGKELVGVVITSKPPPTKRKNKDKAKSASSDKGKGKAKDGENKETFKSREFIQDSDDDTDPLDLIPSEGAGLNQTPTSSSKPKNGIDNLPSKTTSGFKITLPANSSVTAPARSPIRDSDMPKPSHTTEKRTSGSKKRKTVFDSDDAEEEHHSVTDEVIHVTPLTSVPKKRKTGDRKDKAVAVARGKNVVLSDQEDEDVHQVDENGEEPENSAKKSGKKAKAKETKRTKQSKKIISDDEDEIQITSNDVDVQQPLPEEMSKSAKENVVPPSKHNMSTPKPSTTLTNRDGSTPMYARYEIAPRRSSLPMSELIRRANSMPGSPFPTPHSSSSKLKPLIARTPTSTAYSPYLKSSRSLLSRIAPLHPNRRTPPPPPPPPPPRKKSKKELELEDKWEEEMVESVGGMEAWAVLPNEERREMRKMKWARELGDWDD